MIQKERHDLTNRCSLKGTEQRAGLGLMLTELPAAADSLPLFSYVWKENIPVQRAQRMLGTEHCDFVCVPLGMAINRLKTKRRPLYLKTQSLPRCKHFSSRLLNQSVCAVSGTSRCLFSDKYKTHKYSVGRAYSC